MKTKKIEVDCMTGVKSLNKRSLY